MAADVRLILGPNSNQLTQRLLGVSRQCPEQVFWLAPTECYRADLIKQYQIPEAAVWTFPQLVDRLAGSFGNMLPEAHQRMLLDLVVRQLDDKKLLPAFHPLIGQPGFSGTLFSAISELRSLGLSAKQFQAAAQQLGNHAKNADVGQAMSAYESLLRKNEWTDRAAVYEIAFEQFEKSVPIVLKSLRICLVDGFIEFTDVQLKLLHKLQMHMARMWITLPNEPDSKRGGLFAVPGHTDANLHRSLPGLQVETVHETQEDRLTALEFLSRQLFLSDSGVSPDSKGLQLIEAPGIVGEVKLVARAVKEKLLSGTNPDDVLVAARSLTDYADLIQELFAEYGIPVAIEGTISLARQPIISVLLKAARLPAEDWPFNKTATILRSNFVQPDWPELKNDPEVMLDAELLLRMLGEPRDKLVYLNAVAKTAEALDPGFEDEEAEGSIRRKKHELAKRCLPFLKRFFSAWDTMPASATLDKHIDWLKSLTNELGFNQSANDNEKDILHRWWQELDAWHGRFQQLKSKAITSAEFLSTASSIASLIGLPRTESGPGNVRVIPADLAAGLSYQHLFLIGLSERNFPQLGGGPSLYNEQERRDFRGIGIDLEVNEDRIDSEMLLFYRLINGAGHSITFSYPAVDEKGQKLLPATFLRYVKALFQQIPTISRKMLIEGLDDDQPMSPTEYRWRWAKVGGDHSVLPRDMAAHLTAAGKMADKRFRQQEYSEFDGLLKDEKTAKAVAKEFGPAKVFNATALENYIACPFKYFVGSGLGLTTLNDPSDELEQTSRGLAYHRALARLHRSHRIPTADVTEKLRGELERTVAEEAGRASSPMTKMLWQLENQRLQRSADRYSAQWDQFRGKLVARGTLSADYVELDFGSRETGGPFVLKTKEGDIRLGGRIDRIDVMELADGDIGFWIVDYKTGAPGSYTRNAVADLQRLQLPIYALAAEKALRSDRQIRPLGMLYWFPISAGVKHAVPGKPLDWLDDDQWPLFSARVKKWIEDVIGRVRSGQFPLSPRSSQVCDGCEYRQVCRISQSRNSGKKWLFELPSVDARIDD